MNSAFLYYTHRLKKKDGRREGRRETQTFALFIISWNLTLGILLIEDTDLTTGRCCQNIVGIHSSQLMPASIPSGLALNADNFVNPF